MRWRVGAGRAGEGEEGARGSGRAIRVCMLLVQRVDARMTRSSLSTMLSTAVRGTRCDIEGLPICEAAGEAALV